MRCCKKMLRALERDLNCYDRVLLSETPALISVIGQLKLSEVSDEKLLVLSPNICQGQSQNITFRQISREETCQLTKLYFTYEFSDQFHFISRNDGNYASLYYMADAGILSPEEFVAALLS